MHKGLWIIWTLINQQLNNFLVLNRKVDGYISYLRKKSYEEFVCNNLSKTFMIDQTICFFVRNKQNVYLSVTVSKVQPKIYTFANARTFSTVQNLQKL